MFYSIPQMLKAGSLNVALAALAAYKSLIGAGAPANATTITITQEAVGLFNETTLTLTNFAVSVVGATGIGFGGAKLYDFPEGKILHLGASADLSFDWSATSISQTGSGDFSIGTTLNADTSLATTEVNIVPSSAMLTNAVAGISRGVGSTTAIGYFDGTTTPVDAILNILIDDANIAETDTVLVSGTIKILWKNLGDYTAIT